MVEAINRGTNGCRVKTVVPNGTVDFDGRLQPGDYITSINNESNAVY